MKNWFVFFFNFVMFTSGNLFLALCQYKYFYFGWSFECDNDTSKLSNNILCADFHKVGFFRTGPSGNTIVTTLPEKIKLCKAYITFCALQYQKIIGRNENKTKCGLQRIMEFHCKPAILRTTKTHFVVLKCGLEMSYCGTEAHNFMFTETLECPH